MKISDNQDNAARSDPYHALHSATLCKNGPVKPVKCHRYLQILKLAKLNKLV
jgi:hypothetical protein